MADPLHQQIIILRGPQRPASVGLSCKIAAEQIDEIQVGGMGERSATKPAQRQYGKLAARHLPMLRLELPDSRVSQSHQRRLGNPCIIDRSEEHTSELQSLMRISYAVFCLKKKKKIRHTTHTNTQKQIPKQRTR